MKVNYSYSETGCTCDRCGNFIKNVYTIEDEGVKLLVGSECIKKVSNASDAGIKIINAAVKIIKEKQSKIDDFATRDYDLISQKYFYGNYGEVEAPPYQKVPDFHKDYIDRRARTFEEFKQYVEELLEIYKLQIIYQANELNKKISRVKIRN